MYYTLSRLVDYSEYMFYYATSIVMMAITLLFIVMSSISYWSDAHRANVRKRAIVS